MGGFCTRSICHVEPGDPEYSKLIDRGSNMDDKQPDQDKLASDEPAAAYTHSGEHHKPRSKSRSKSIQQVPTPTVEEIQSAMNNLGAMFDAKSNSNHTKRLRLPSSNDAPLSDHKANAEASKLPTLADDVSHLELANPFGSPAVSEYDRGQHLPAVPSQTELNVFTYDELHGKKVDGDRSSSPDPEVADIAAPAAEDPSSAAMLRADSNSTIVIHGDEDEEAMAKLTLQCEGSSEMRDETNTVFSPPPGRAAESGNVQKAKEKQDEQHKEHVQANRLEVKVESVPAKKTKKLIAESSNESVASMQNGKQKLLQMDSNQLTDPWQSDYEPSDLDSRESSKRGEEHEETDKKANSKLNVYGKKRRASKEETKQPPLKLNYDETTLNDESSSDEESPRPEKHRMLIREESEMKWQRKDVVKTQKQMLAEYKKLKVEQEIHEVSTVMTFYRQQSQQ